MPTYFRLRGVLTFGAVARAMGLLIRPAVSDRTPKSSPQLLPNVPPPRLSNPVPLPFKTLTAPSPKFKKATVGILIAPQYSAQAAGFARYAAAQINTKGRWTKISLYVFTNPKDAEAFKKFQSPRTGRPLNQADFVRLTSLAWATGVLGESRQDGTDTPTQQEPSELVSEPVYSSRTIGRMTGN